MARPTHGFVARRRGCFDGRRNDFPRLHGKGKFLPSLRELALGYEI